MSDADIHTGDFGADPDPSSVPSGDSVTLIETISDFVNKPEIATAERLNAARAALAVLELRESDRQSACGCCPQCLNGVPSECRGLGSASALEVEKGTFARRIREAYENGVNAICEDIKRSVPDWDGADLHEDVRETLWPHIEPLIEQATRFASATKPEASPSPEKSLKLGDDRVVWVNEPRLAALFHIAHCALSGLEGSEATEQAVEQNLDTADALRADLIKWIATAQTPLVSALGVGAGEGDWRESDVVKAARKTLTDYEGHPDYVPLPESQWAALLEGVLAERDFIGEWLQRMLDEAAGVESVHDAYDKGWSEAEAHFATTTAGAEWERAELWRSKANDMDSRLKLATAFVENAGPVVGNRAELLLILSGTTTTTAEPYPSPESPYGHDPFARGDLKPSRPVSTDEEEGQGLEDGGLQSRPSGGGS